MYLKMGNGSSNLFSIDCPSQTQIIIWDSGQGNYQYILNNAVSILSNPNTYKNVSTHTVAPILSTVANTGNALMVLTPSNMVLQDSAFHGVAQTSKPVSLTFTLKNGTKKVTVFNVFSITHGLYHLEYLNAAQEWQAILNVAIAVINEIIAIIQFVVDIVDVVALFV